MSVGALITWPYKAGGRSRRGSPKAGTTVASITLEFSLKCNFPGNPQIGLNLSSLKWFSLINCNRCILLDTGLILALLATHALAATSQSRDLLKCIHRIDYSSKNIFHT